MEGVCHSTCMYANIDKVLCVCVLAFPFTFPHVCCSGQRVQVQEEMYLICRC